MHLLDHARRTQRYVGFCAVPTAVGSDEICMYEILWLEFKLDIKLQFLKILFKTKTCELCFIFYKVSQWQYKATLSALWVAQNQHQQA